MFSITNRLFNPALQTLNLRFRFSDFLTHRHVDGFCRFGFGFCFCHVLREVIGVNMADFTILDDIGKVSIQCPNGVDSLIVEI